MAIRAGTEADQPVIERMVAREHLDPRSLDWRHFLVAEEDGHVVGIGQIKTYGSVRELGSLIVLPAYRNRGIAAALIQALDARAERPLYLFCRDRMVPYYERFGFHLLAFHDAPPDLQRRLRIPRLFRFIDIHIVPMRKD